MSYTTPPQPAVNESEAAQGGNFREGALAVAPAFLSGEWGSKFVYTQAIQWDGLAEYLRIGILQRFPEYCQPEGLASLGLDRRIWRGLTESDENYASRLRQFKQTWRFAGNAPTLITQLYELMNPDAVRIRYVVNGYDADGVQFADWWTIDSTGLSYERVSPSNWDWDGKRDKQIRFWLIIYRTDLAPAKWGVPPYQWSEPGLIWGGEPGNNVRDWVADTFAIVKSFKAAGSALGPWGNFDGGLIVADPTWITAPWGAGGPFDPSLPAGAPMPDGTWNVPGNRTTEGAVYLSGLA